MDTNYAVLTNPSEKMRKEAEVFSLKVRKRKKKNSSKVWFTSEYSFELVEDSFYNSTVFFLKRQTNFVTQYQKKVKFFSRKNSFASKCSHTRKKRSFIRLVGNFAKKPENFPLNNRKWKKIFFSKKIRLRIFLWTQRKLFWPSYWNLFYKKPAVFCSLSESHKKNFPPNLFFQQSVLFGQVERSFDEAFGISSTKCRKNFANWPTMIRNHISSSGNIFPHSVPMEM